MYYIFKNLKHITIILMFVSVLFFLFGVFLPLRNKLELQLNEVFKNNVLLVEENIENSFDNFMEGAESLSSRTMIRNKLIEYKNGEITFSNLKNYTQNKYVDGAKVLDNLIAAYRIINNKIIASCGVKDYQSFIKYVSFDNKSTSIKLLDNKGILIVNSLVKKNNGTKLANDIVIYDLKSLFKDINSSDYNYDIIYNEKEINEKVENDSKIINYKKILNTNYWLKVKVNTSELYRTIDSLFLKIIGGLIVLILIVIISFYKVLNSTSKKVINQLEEKIEKITKLSETDEMLETYNRSKLMDMLAKELERAQRYENNLSVIMFDLDYFKKINDEYGHIIGDEILVEVVIIIKNEIREGDFLGRYGGDEFIIVNPETNLSNSTMLAERLRIMIENNKFNKVEDVSCSFGVTELKINDDLDSLLKRVDDALYKAKRNGKNRVEKIS